jgi:hydroxymethylpyrimidine pyrophosphatase-like HAD family hydrolase
MNMARSDAEAASPDLAFLRDKKRLILTRSIIALSLVAIVAVLVTTYIEYQAALKQTRARLHEIADGRAALIEAVGRFDAQGTSDYPGGAESATLSQILSAHKEFTGFGKTGEFTLAQRQGDRIQFLLSHRHDGEVNRESVPWGAKEAEPMRRALQGQTGSLIGLDYRSERVLAAHMPVKGLKWGIVAKIDLAEIRSSSIRSGLVALGFSMLVIAIGVAFLIKITSRIIEDLELRTRELHFQTIKRSHAERELAEARSLLLASIQESGSKLSRVEGAQISYIRALAFDYDGTLTQSGRPSKELLSSLQELRVGGRKLILVTGRIMKELRLEFDDVDECFDLIVAENGAVLYRNGIGRNLAPAIPTEIDQSLRNRQVAHRRGEVIIACEGRYAEIVLEELTRLQLDSQISRNRGEMMLLPAGVSKGTGLTKGLALLGISSHNTIAVGDAENDISLLNRCELFVAVANAVPSLKAQADLLLDKPAGEGVMKLLQHPILRGDEWIESKRWKLRLGHTPEGNAVTLPASQINVLITGGSGSGKSFAAGLVAEQLIELGYSICVFDPEGDHVNLAQLRGVSHVGGGHLLPAPEHLFSTHQGLLGSIVIDLTGVPSAEKQSYVSEALPVLNEQRNRTGTPHWIIVDEAHEPFSELTIANLISSGQKGFCLITYKPGAVQADTKMAFDFVLAVAGAGHAREVAGMVSGFTSYPVEALERFLQRGAQRGQSLLIRVSSLDFCALTLAPRTLTHVRHQHKYASSSLPPDQHFIFRSETGLTGGRATNIEEFHRQLQSLEDGSLVHHLRCHDFSRWIEASLQDAELSRTIFEMENRVNTPDPSMDLETLRCEVLTAIYRNYLE